MSKTFGYAICNNKITQILHGSKAVWYDDEGNRRVEEVKYIVADNWEHAKELIKQSASEVAVSKTETTAPVAVAENATTTQAWPKPLNMAKARAALVEIIEYLEPIRKWTMPSKENHTRLTALFAAVDTVYTKAKAALEEPARNCDKYPTHKEALDAWLDADPKESGCCDEWLYKIAKESEVENGSK